VLQYLQHPRTTSGTPPALFFNLDRCLCEFSVGRASELQLDTSDVCLLLEHADIS
jgi:hypothetical protein